MSIKEVLTFLSLADYRLLDWYNLGGRRAQGSGTFAPEEHHLGGTSQKERPGWSSHSKGTLYGSITTFLSSCQVRQSQVAGSNQDTHKKHERHAGIFGGGVTEKEGTAATQQNTGTHMLHASAWTESHSVVDQRVRPILTNIPALGIKGNAAPR